MWWGCDLCCVGTQQAPLSPSCLEEGQCHHSALYSAGHSFNLAQGALLFITLAPVPLTIPHDFIRKKKVTGGVIAFIINACSLSSGSPPPPALPLLRGNSADVSSLWTILGHGEGGRVRELHVGMCESLVPTPGGGVDGGDCGRCEQPQHCGTELGGLPEVGSLTEEKRLRGTAFPKIGCGSGWSLSFCISATTVGQAHPGGGRLLGRGL